MLELNVADLLAELAKHFGEIAVPRNRWTPQREYCFAVSQEVTTTQTKGDREVVGHVR